MTRPAATVHSRIGSVAGLASLGLFVVLAQLPASPARAVIPSAPKVRAEIARSNAEAGRTQPLALDVVLVGESGGALATGRARLDPQGVARLELALVDGSRELHERSPDGYVASRDGVPLGRFQPLLPPSQLLQAGTEADVAAALRAIGGDPDQVDLGMSDGADCWVLGGRDPGPFDASRRPSYWFDLAARRALRIDDAGAVSFRLGPAVKRDGGIAFPAWIYIEAPGWPSRRLDVQRVAPASPATAPRLP
jgi:hypothetical protein